MLLGRSGGVGNIGAFIVRIGFGVYYAIIIIRKQNQNPILILKAPYIKAAQGCRWTKPVGSFRSVGFEDAAQPSPCGVKSKGIRRGLRARKLGEKSPALKASKPQKP